MKTQRRSLFWLWLLSALVLSLGFWRCGPALVCQSDLECRRGAVCTGGQCTPGEHSAEVPSAEPTQDVASGESNPDAKEPIATDAGPDARPDVSPVEPRSEPVREVGQETTGEPPSDSSHGDTAEVGSEPVSDDATEPTSDEATIDGDAGDGADEPGCKVDADCGAAARCVTGRCVPICQPACTAGATQCIGNAVQTCGKPSGCEAWGTPVPCSTGQQCAQGQCVARGCKTDADCPSGKLCQGSACVVCPTPCTVGQTRCQGSQVSTCAARNGCGQWGQAAACPTGQICKANACSKGCASDLGCSSGEICVANACVSGCRGTVDCAIGQICHLLKCRKPCTNDNQCSGGYFCRAEGGTKVCGIACQTLSDCKQNYLCTAGSCQPSTSCTSHSNCPHNFGCFSNGRCGTRCDLGACIANHTCNSAKDKCEAKLCNRDSECAGRYACVNGRCLATCQKHEDCHASYYCSAGRCLSGCLDDKSCRGFKCDTRYKRCGTNCIASSQCVAGYSCSRPHCLKHCQLHTDCPHGVACYSRRCRSICSISAHCRVGFQCVNTTCVPKTTCTSNADCGEGYACSNGTCKTSCAGSQDCATGFVCTSSVCQQPPCNVATCKGYACHTGPAAPCKSSCQTSADCWTGFVCAAGKCQGAVCQQNTDCPYGGICYMGTCAATCTHQEHCRTGFYCSGSRCLALPASCVSSANCPSSHYCLRGMCTMRSASRVPYQRCTSNINCPTGHTCIQTGDELDATKTKRCLPTCNRSSITSSTGCSSASLCRTTEGSTSFRGAGGCFRACTKNADCWGAGASFYCSQYGICMDRTGVQGVPYKIPCYPGSSLSCPADWDCVNASYRLYNRYHCMKDCFRDTDCASNEVCRRDRGDTGSTSRMGCFRKCTFSTRSICTAIRPEMYCATARSVCAYQ